MGRLQTVRRGPRLSRPSTLDLRPGCQRSKVEEGVVGAGLHVDAMYYIGRSRRRVRFGDIMEYTLQLLGEYKMTEGVL
jgi:hypothetical protein